MFADRVMTRMDCSLEFTFTAAEQQFFDQMGFRNPPRRCKECRRKRKAEGGSGGGGASPGGGRPSRRPAANRTMYPATCSECGAETQVPFEPDPARATFCTDCFRKRRRNPTA